MNIGKSMKKPNKVRMHTKALPFVTSVVFNHVVDMMREKNINLNFSITLT